MQRYTSTLPETYNHSVYPAGQSEPSRYDVCLTDKEKKVIPLIFTIDSGHRNYAVRGRMGGATEISRTQYTHGQYSVPLPSTYRDVVSIELVRAFIPYVPRADGGDERYLILSIGYSRILSNNPAVEGSLCNLYLDRDDQGYDYARGGPDPDAVFTYFFTEPTNVQKLDIRLTYPDGVLLGHTDGCGAAHVHAHVLSFEIKTPNLPKMLI